MDVLNRGSIKEEKENNSSLKQTAITIIILDWDDTCIPSFWLQDVNRYLNAEEIEDFVTISKLVISIINQAKEYAHVIIVTNAQEDWVQTSCKNYLPSLFPYISKIPIVSAYERYSNLYKYSSQWKLAAFYHETINYIRSNAKVNIVSIGDSDAEFIAVNSLKKVLPTDLNTQLITKGIKLIERPTPKLLIQQLEIIHKNLKEIVDIDESINQKITASLIPTNPSSFV